jgi:CDP-paratose 2-epimerase
VKTILVTGGAGFIGSNLAIDFKQKYPKLKIICLDNLKRRGSELNLLRLKERGINFIHADIRNPEDLVIEDKIDLLIECSAEPSVLAGFGNNPLYILNTNLTGSINCFELARKHKAAVIFLSTSRVYPYAALNGLKFRESLSRFEWRPGQDETGLSLSGITEKLPLEGSRTLYGATKLASEVILQEYATNYGLKFVVNRCGVVTGPWQFGKVDQGVFTLWMMAHYFKRPLSYIGFGGQGKQVRDLLHIDDLFRLIDLQSRSLDRVNGMTFNAGGGEGSNLSLAETTLVCRKITGNRIKISSSPANRPGDIRIYITDNTAVTGKLGWKPEKTPAQILNDTHRWIRQNEKSIRDSL